MTNASTLIGQIVTVSIDRPLGSNHPKFGFIYPLNYGFIPGTMAGDEEPLDAYVLGIYEPLQAFEGKCIAVISRTDDNEEKLVVVPDGKDYSNEQIMALLEFQERYFKSSIIR